MTMFTAFSDAMTGTNSGYGGQSPGCDVREVILVANLSNVYSGPVQASVTIKSQSGSNGTLASAWIGSSGGGTNNVNFKGDQAQIKWSGSNSLALSGAQTYAPSDLTATFNYDPTVPLVISLFFTGTNCTAASHTNLNGAAGNNYNLSHADQTAATTATYANADNFYSWVSKIDLTEVATDPGPSVRRNPSYRTAVFAPAVVWAPTAPAPIAPTVVFPVITPDPIRANYQPVLNSTTQPALGLAFRTAITPSAGFDLSLQDDRPIRADYRAALAATTTPRFVLRPIIAYTPNLGFDLTLQDDRPIARDYRVALGSTSSVPFVAPPTAPTYYVDSSIGSDSNDGLTPSTAWLTIAKVNTQTWTSNGTHVLFNGGQTFNGTITPQNGLAANNPLTFGSYGTGQATINGGSVGGFLATGMGGITVRDLIFTGTSTLTNTADGIRFDNNQAGNTQLPAVSVINCTVSGFGINGILVTGTNGRSGYNGVLIDSCTVHDCTGNFTGNSGSAGIIVFSFAGYGMLSLGGASHSNVTIQNSVSYNNQGKAAAGNWTGSGIFIGETNNGLIQNCIAHHNGALSSTFGTVGIWTGDATNITIQFCEAYNNVTTAGADGDGYDLDGGCQNCTIQYCYSQGNYGTGFLVYTYDDATLLQDINKVVRFCISQNDATSVGAGILFGSDSTRAHTGDIYNNTVFNNGKPCFGIGGAHINISTGRIANNIFYSTNNAPFVIGYPSDGNPALMTVVGNDYYNTGTFSLRWNSTTYSTYAAWQTATGQEKVAGVNVGLTSNPLLVNPGTSGVAGGYNPAALAGYIALTGSPAIGGGQNLLSLYGINVGIQDFFGNPALLNGSSVGADSQFVTLFIGTQRVDWPIPRDYRAALGSTTTPIWPSQELPATGLCELGTVDGNSNGNPVGLVNLVDTLGVLRCPIIVISSLIDRPSTIRSDYRITLLSTTSPVQPVSRPSVTVPTFPIFSNKEGNPISPDYSRALFSTSAVHPRVFTPLVTLTPSFWVQNPDYTLPDWW